MLSRFSLLLAPVGLRPEPCRGRLSPFPPIGSFQGHRIEERHDGPRGGSRQQTNKSKTMARSLSRSVRSAAGSPDRRFACAKNEMKIEKSNGRAGEIKCKNQISSSPATMSVPVRRLQRARKSNSWLLPTLAISSRPTACKAPGANYKSGPFCCHPVGWLAGRLTDCLTV